MFDQKIVILVVLGVAIYFLTKPSSHDNTPKIHKKNNMPSNNKKHSPAPTPAPVVRETFTNSKKNVEGFAKRQRFNDPLESSFDEFPGNFTAKEIVDSSEENKTDDKSKGKAHVHKTEVKAVTTGNAFGRLLPEGTDPNAMPDVKNDTTFNKDDFLPKHSNKKWFDKVVDLDDSALFKAKPETFIGVDTQGQSLRNASRDLRGEVGLANPRGTFVWNNPTIGHDNNRRPMTIGNFNKN